MNKSRMLFLLFAFRDLAYRISANTGADPVFYREVFKRKG